MFSPRGEDFATEYPEDFCEDCRDVLFVDDGVDLDMIFDGADPEVYLVCGGCAKQKIQEAIGQNYPETKIKRVKHNRYEYTKITIEIKTKEG